VTDNGWERHDYERQWLEAARRLVVGSSRTGFFTDAFRFWWTAYRDGEHVYVQEMFIGTERYQPEFGAPVPYHLIEDRRTHTGDGDPISEWEITMDDVRDFVRRREKGGARTGSVKAIRGRSLVV
jgi:hypothetical protein